MSDEVNVSCQELVSAAEPSPHNQHKLCLHRLGTSSRSSSLQFKVPSAREKGARGRPQARIRKLRHRLSSLKPTPYGGCGDEMALDRHNLVRAADAQLQAMAKHERGAVRSGPSDAAGFVSLCQTLLERRPGHTSMLGEKDITSMLPRHP